MRMKRILLASAAVAVLAGAHQAQAASDLYVSFFGGANFLAEDSEVLDFAGGFGDTEAYSSDPSTGFTIGGAIGTSLQNWAKGLAVELEVSYRRNDVAGTWTTDGAEGGESGLIDGNMATFAIMANVMYEIDIGTKVRPYLGGGAGWARVSHDAAFIETVNNSVPVSPNVETTGSDENSGFAWQLAFGFNYEVAPDVDVGLGYRYFVGPNVQPFHDFNSDSRHDNENHGVHVNLTVGVN
jgi:OmpA-OmpF porin, OOP family